MKEVIPSQDGYRIRRITEKDSKLREPGFDFIVENQLTVEGLEVDERQKARI